jgi:hypothetical protein
LRPSHRQEQFPGNGLGIGKACHLPAIGIPQRSLDLRILVEDSEAFLFSMPFGNEVITVLPV